MSNSARGGPRRRLAAIVVAGYSRSPGLSEESSFASRRELLGDVIEPRVAEFDGNIFKRTGDNVLVEFASVIDASRCVALLRDDIAQRNTGLPSNRQITLRIGINLGDVIVEAGDVFGDGVNIAARLEGIAEPGAIYVSEVVHGQVAGKIDREFDDLGPQSLKNISQPVRVYRLRNLAGMGEPSDRGTAEPTRAEFDSTRAIAVLPFANFSGDPEQEYFADGITEDIITRLAGWRAFPVIARNSTFTYRGKTVDIKKVGQELGVRYVLEGSVRKSGRRVRVTAQLIRADNGHHLMAEKYDRDLTDLFELQDEIVSAIAGTIEPELLKYERDRIASRPEHREDAYQLYQRGMWHHYRHSKADNLEAQRLFAAALAADPEYPQATAALSMAVCNAGFLGWAERPDNNYAECYELAQRAIALDARDPMARFAFAIACMYTRRSERAMDEFRQVIKLNPSHAAAYALLGQMLTYAGRFEETIPLVEQGIRLSPSDPRLFIWLPALAGAHYQLREYDTAVDIGRRSWVLNRNWPVGLRYAVAGLAQLGRMDEAQAVLGELKQIDPDPAAFESLARRLFSDGEPVDHLFEGLRKAGYA